MERLQQLYTEHQQKLYHYFYVRTANAQVAEDLTQDVFYEASRTLHLYRGDASLTTWMYAIANNLLKKYYRSKTYERSLFQKLDRPVATRALEEDVAEKWAVQELFARIQQLDDIAQQIIVLRIYSELSFKEIGDIIGRSENYTRVQFHRLKQQLKKGG